MNVKKMLSLAKFLEKLPRKRFDIQAWIRKQKKHGDELDDDLLVYNPTKPVKPLEPNCGTACCIAGWQASRMGLYLDTNGHVYRKNSSKEKGERDFSYVGNVSDVVAKDLELDPSVANRLFTDWSLRTPKQAAKKVRLMVEQEKETKYEHQQNAQLS